MNETTAHGIMQMRVDGERKGMRLCKPGSSAALLLTIALLCSGSATAHGADVLVTDAGGRQVRIADASRILSVGGDVTEIVYALGAGGRLVGVDSTSQFPPQALKEKKNVGYMRALSSEGVMSVDATLILASERSGPPEVVKTLKATSVPYVEVPDQHSAAGIAAKVRLVARAVGAEAEGERVVGQVESDFRLLAERAARIGKPLKALFVLAVQNGRAVVGGRGTSADAILRLAGAQNVASEVNGFRPLPDEAIVELAPEVVVTMRRSSGNDAHDTSQILALKGLSSTPAGTNSRIVTMDGLYLLGFGPRAPAAARDLMLALYPDLAGGTTGTTR
jgi:iron complex transport system substrate-binding protein